MKRSLTKEEKSMRWWDLAAAVLTLAWFMVNGIQIGRLVSPGPDPRLTFSNLMTWYAVGSSLMFGAIGVVLLIVGGICSIRRARASRQR